MPQMAPLNWLSLMITFVLIMMMFNLTNYFTFNYDTLKSKKSQLKIKKINWKW